MRERHGKCRTKLYGIWCSMKSRCHNPSNPAYKNYGGRGISVCDRWLTFSHFYEDLGGDPPAGKTLERRDNDKGYSPENCLWASRTTQSRNRRSLIMITMDGETHPLSVWTERFGLNYKTIHMRILKGWDPEQAIKTPDVTNRRGVPRGKKIHDFQHHIVNTPAGPMTLGEAIDASGLNPGTVSQRLRRGWSAQEAISLPPRKGRRVREFGARHDVVFHDAGEFKKQGESA